MLNAFRNKFWVISLSDNDNKNIKLLKTKLFCELIQKNKEMKERILQVIEKNYKINCKLFIV